MALSTTKASGTQSTSQTSLQASNGSGADFTAGQSSSGVQPGTATSVLTTNEGALALHPGPVSTVNLAAGSAATTTATTTTSPAKTHHTNPALYGISGLFLLVAIILFWSTSRSAKSTTEY